MCENREQSVSNNGDAFQVQFSKYIVSRNETNDPAGLITMEYSRIKMSYLSVSSAQFGFSSPLQSSWTPISPILFALRSKFFSSEDAFLRIHASDVQLLLVSPQLLSLKGKTATSDSKLNEMDTAAVCILVLCF